MEKQTVKQQAKEEFASWKSLFNLIKTLAVVAGITWAVGQLHAEKFVDDRIEASKTPQEEKLSWKLANEIDVPQDRVHIYFGLMFRNLSQVTDSIGVFRTTLLPKIIRLTNLTFVGPVVENGHNLYIDFDNEVYRIRGINTDQPYWVDARDIKRDLAGKKIR